MVKLKRSIIMKDYHTSNKNSSYKSEISLATKLFSFKTQITSKKYLDLKETNSHAVFILMSYNQEISSLM